MERIDLEYVHVTKEVQRTIYDFPIIENITEYDGITIRNRVILKFDILAGMSNVFSKDTIKDYRDLAFGIVSGYIHDANSLSTVLTALYTDDDVFHKYLSVIYLFDESLKEKSLANVLSCHLLDDYRIVFSMLVELLRLQRCKTILESSGYIYVSIPDDKFTLKIPGHFNEEVLSNAKVWNFDVERIEPKI